MYLAFLLSTFNLIRQFPLLAQNSSQRNILLARITFLLINLACDNNGGIHAVLSTVEARLRSLLSFGGSRVSAIFGSSLWYRWLLAKHFVDIAIDDGNTRQLIRCLRANMVVVLALLGGLGGLERRLISQGGIGILRLVILRGRPETVVPRRKELSY